MADRILTGTRLRRRRLERGLRQSDLANRIGISASYLNLIEHNRRRIGARLLQDIAQVLDIDADVLREGTGGALLAPLREAAAAFPDAAVEEESAEDIIARYPGWAALIAAQRARISQLEARIEGLSNRLLHDTQIAASLHEVISTATSIRSTASILTETPDLDRDWQARFHRNIDGDSQRLAESSQALLGFLDVEAEAAGQTLSAVEQAEAAIASLGYHVPQIEAGGSALLDTLMAGEASHEPDGPLAAPRDPAAREILQGWLDSYARDAAALPLAPLVQAARQDAYDPARLAARFAAPLDLVLRRLAHLPSDQGHPPMGLAVCDASGVITFQKPVLEFRLPRAGGACPLWPLFQALSQPMRALRRPLRLSGLVRTTFECFAIAAPVGPVRFGEEQRITATMLIRPAPQAETPDIVGPGCRVCPVEACESRRHPSLLRPPVVHPL